MLFYINVRRKEKACPHNYVISNLTFDRRSGSLTTRSNEMLQRRRWSIFITFWSLEIDWGNVWVCVSQVLECLSNQQYLRKGRRTRLPQRHIEIFMQNLWRDKTSYNDWMTTGNSSRDSNAKSLKESSGPGVFFHLQKHTRQLFFFFFLACTRNQWCRDKSA